MVINKIKLLRNIGQFDSVSSGAAIPLTRLTLVYAENGRGKTTLSAVLRSLATGDPLPIVERRRLDADQPPHVILECDGGPPSVMFHNGVWNRTLPNIAIFDDAFVDRNVYSGLVVAPDHRKNLHELILGAQGVSLNRHLQDLTAKIEVHNSTLRAKAAAIPAIELGARSVNDFCALPSRPEIDDEIRAAEQILAAARDQGRVRDMLTFETLHLPAFDTAAIKRDLALDLPAIDAAAVALVQAHFAGAGQGREAWTAEGMSGLSHFDTDGVPPACPFCAQDLSGSPIIDHYRAYFSDAYRDLKHTLAEALAGIQRTHGGEVPAGFERAVRIAGERRQYWSQFCNVPAITLDTAAILRGWTLAHELARSVLATKQSAPLEPVTLSDTVLVALTAYETHRQTVAGLNAQLQQVNIEIMLVKEQAERGDPTALAADVARLKAVKARNTLPLARLCDDYLAEQTAKSQTEQARDQAKADLDHYRASAFPGYQTAINVYLQRFNAGFRLDSIMPVDRRGGPTCTYSVLINDVSIPITSESGSGEPAFHNTLSAGDRTTLALAFFFASLDQDSALRAKLIVIDDPVSSLDDHRSLTTVQEVRRLTENSAQVLVLSHSQTFLCRLWEGAAKTDRSALEVRRDTNGSTIVAWDVAEHAITEHDRRHDLLSRYLIDGSPAAREVARAIRPHLEGFLRVACPGQFSPGTLLGSFRSRCMVAVDTRDQILGRSQVQELHDLTEYANRFHHDTPLCQ